MLMDMFVWKEIRLQGTFMQMAMRVIEATKFPVQDMVSHTFTIEETEHCIRAVGGEIPDLYPVKALIKP
jgi:threonine dehydrogenase-like Zn-dependent dehydrogenase